MKSIIAKKDGKEFSARVYAIDLDGVGQLITAEWWDENGVRHEAEVEVVEVLD